MKLLATNLLLLIVFVFALATASLTPACKTGGDPAATLQELEDMPEPQFAAACSKASKLSHVATAILLEEKHLTVQQVLDAVSIIEIAVATGQPLSSTDLLSSVLRRVGLTDSKALLTVLVVDMFVDDFIVAPAPGELLHPRTREFVLSICDGLRAATLVKPSDVALALYQDERAAQ